MLQKAFTLWATTPILRDLTTSDSALLLNRVPPAKLQEHLENNRAFMETFVERCRGAGIPIQVGAEEIDGLVHAIVLYCLHQDELGPEHYPGTAERLLELTAAYCLGEVHCELAASHEDHTNDPGH